MKTYKLSRYNSIYPAKKGVYLYNSLTGLKCHIYDKELLNQLALLEKENDLEENKVDKQFIHTKVVVESSINELSMAEDVIVSSLSHNTNKLRLIILPTRECNFRCKYCYETKTASFMTQETTDNLINATIKYLQDNKGIEFLHLEWFGGEPLLCYDKIIFISSQLKEYCDTNAVSFYMTMTTNGYLLKKEYAEKLLSLNLSSYQITVDGQARYHDNLRILKNGAPTWKKIYANLLALKSIDNPNLSVTIRINYYLDMLEDIPDFLEKLKNDFDKRFSVYAIRINPTPTFEKEFDCINAETEEMALEYILNIFKETGLSIDRYLPNLYPTSAACYARMNYCYVIDTDGTIRKCTEYLDDNIQNNIGTIQNGIFEIDSYKHIQWLYPPKNSLHNNNCYECKDYPNCCGGICPAQWLYKQSVTCNPLRKLNESLLGQYIDEKNNKK